MNQWDEFCPGCIHYQGSIGVCAEQHFNVRDYPTMFAKKCDGQFYKHDPNKKINEAVAEVEQKVESNSDPRHTSFRKINIVDMMRMYKPEPGCMLCQSENETELNSARFYYGQFSMSREIKVLVRETKTQSRILGHKSFNFCNSCLEKMVIEKKKKKNKYVMTWLGSFLLWLIILIASAAVEIPILIGGIFIAGLVLAIRFVPRMMKNSFDIVALLKKGGEKKFEDFLDNEAIRLFLKDKNRDDFAVIAFWTRSQYDILKE